MTSNDRHDLPLLRALRREPLPHPPVWLMRQAGRYLPEYRATREQAGGFMEMVREPALAAEVTLQPIRRFQPDAAILFSDILVPLEAMGLPLEFGARGPHIARPVRDASAIEDLRVPDPERTMPFVGEALERVRAELPAGVALLGFCGAPFTLACYATEGGSSPSYPHVRRLMHRERPAFEALMERLAETVALHLRHQVEHGADAVVLFDTWAGLLTPEDYRLSAAPWSRRALEGVPAGVPRIAYANSAGHLLEDLADLGAEAVGVDQRTPLVQAFERVGGRVALQGNLDPGLLLAHPEEVAERTRSLLRDVGGRPGHVLNLGHGVLKETDPESVGAFVETARSFRP